MCHADGACFRYANQPLPFEEPIQQRRAKRAADVRPALRPIQALCSQTPPLRSEFRCIDIQRSKPPIPGPGNLERTGTDPERATAQQFVPNGDRKRSRQMVIAGSRKPDSGHPRLRWVVRERTERFHRGRDLRGFQPEKPLPALALKAHQISGREFSEVCARGLCRNLSCHGEVRCRMSLSVEHHREHPETRGLSD